MRPLFTKVVMAAAQHCVGLRHYRYLYCGFIQ